ncbi:hypothetical protein HYH02_014007 [Chlamydomonas schloesseri]|uniref:EF-hand domain-containing protein n=1 Tax=Chlamydomonas schloesseri TaxID=2026947 RepID=A0A835SMC7_9CHLO|nr:hypothetical protein HYH02_014007 [Chlamydomonas schloesseri]|eukprot:KAG2429669.1 hypothetical protein HYH02_014007 [Chlamydomonas schloesseri]
MSLQWFSRCGPQLPLRPQCAGASLGPASTSLARQLGPLGWRRSGRSVPAPVHTASRDEDLEVERPPPASSSRGAREQHAPDPAAASVPAARIAASGQELGILSSSSLPNLSCSTRDASCVSIRSIADPREDPSLSRQVRDYMAQLVAGGMRAERAAHIIARWSGGGGAGAVDLTKLRRHFMLATLLPTLQQRLPSALIDICLTSASFWSLGLLPTADESLLHPALRGALVAVNLLLLVHFASCSLRTTGRVIRIGNAAVTFSKQAELVLLALQGLADGHGAIIAAAQGSPLAAVLAAADADVDLDRVMAASAAAMAHAKAGGGGAAAGPAAAAPRMAPAAAAAASPPPSALSSLDSFLVLAAAAAGSPAARGAGGRPTSASGGFDAVAELGLSPEEAAAAAAAYSRYGDSSRSGRIGDYELRRLLQEAGSPSLSPAELSLVLLLHDPDKKGWLGFRDWATWWAGAGGAAAAAAAAAATAGGATAAAAKAGRR